MAQSHLSDSQRERIVLAYTSGQTAEEAGRAFRVTGGDVRYVLRKKGIPRRANGVRGLTVVSLSEVDKAYIAGIVDGEGGIDVRFTGKGARTPSGRVIVWNTYKPLIDWLTETIGAGRSSSRVRANAKVQGTKPCYMWEVNSRQNVLALLHQLLPYLKIKKEKAKTVSETVRY